MLPFEIEQKKLVKITNDGVIILDDDIKKQINRKQLSPSMINAFNTSPGEWVLGSFIEPLVALEEPIHFARGHWYHSVMEEFFRQEERTPEALKQALTKVTKENEDYMKLMKDPDNKAWMLRCLQGFSELISRNDNGLLNNNVAKLFYQGNSKDGLEFFVRENLEGINHSCLGFVDCILEEEGGLKIVDWKTGKFHAGDPGYELQQTLYSMLLEKAGLTVNSACLVFPIGNQSNPSKWAPVVEDIDIHNPDVRDKVMKTVESVDRELAEIKENGYFFPFRKHRWNNWESFLTGNGSAWPPKIDKEKFYSMADLSEIR